MINIHHLYNWSDTIGLDVRSVHRISSLEIGPYATLCLYAALPLGGHVMLQSVCLSVRLSHTGF